MKTAAIRRIIQRLRSAGHRIALDWRYQRDLALLVRANDRMLADIGLTRQDVVVAARESDRWFGRGQTLHAAALRREDAMAISHTRRKTLPYTEAPSLAPSAPHAMETQASVDRQRR